MISFMLVLVFSFATLCLGTYVAERVEQRCPACGQQHSCDGLGEELDEA